jgi:hypothetical protein
MDYNNTRHIMDYNNLINRLILGIFGMLGTFMFKYVDNLNQNIRALQVEQLKLQARIEYEEQRTEEALYRIEKELGKRRRY